MKQFSLGDGRTCYLRDGMHTIIIDLHVLQVMYTHTNALFVNYYKNLTLLFASKTKLWHKQYYRFPRIVGYPVTLK